MNGDGNLGELGLEEQTVLVLEAVLGRLRIDVGEEWLKDAKACVGVIFGT